MRFIIGLTVMGLGILTFTIIDELSEFDIYAAGGLVIAGLFIMFFFRSDENDRNDIWWGGA